MRVDREYCASSYLTYRYIFDRGVCFSEKYPVRIADISFPRTPIRTADDLHVALWESVEKYCLDGKAALALSGGIDSAILARLVPEGAKAYTFRCRVEGKEVADETQQAAYWARLNALDHEIIDITWEDVSSAVDLLMRRKGAPVHSIETQIYKAARKAKESGFERMLFGENADIIYGGMNKLLEKDWLFGEFVERYSYVKPYFALKKPVIVLEPFAIYEVDGKIDAHRFINQYFRQEALGTYTNACEAAGIAFAGPYSETDMDAPIDYVRVRNGDTKYLVRELFTKLYPGERAPEKIPMPRPVDEWFSEWKGPSRDEFLPHCTDAMTGDQKWMVWCLERFLNMLDEETNE